MANAGPNGSIPARIKCAFEFPSLFAHNNLPPANLFGQVSSSNVGSVRVGKMANAGPNGDIGSIPAR